MKSLTHTVAIVAVATLMFGASIASAQVSGMGGGEGTGSSGHFETLGMNPQNDGIGTNTASAGSNGMSNALVALTIGLLSGAVAYASLSKVFVRA